MKNEKEKMLNGELYNAADPVLINERLNARRLTRLFNQTIETDENKRIELLLKARVARIKDRVCFGRPFFSVLRSRCSF
jgi:hypothetical protein